MIHNRLCFIEFNPLMSECRICDVINKTEQNVLSEQLAGHEIAYEQGQRDAINAAVQRLEALRYGPEEMYEVADMYHATLAAIKGEINA